MAKKNKKIADKKYPTGGKVINNFIQSPQEAMYQTQINYAKAAHEAKKDPWIMGAKLAGQAGMQLGMAAGGLGTITGKNGDPLFGQGVTDMLHAGMGMSSQFAFGGAVGDPEEEEVKKVLTLKDGDSLTEEEAIEIRNRNLKGLTPEQRIKTAKIGSRANRGDVNNIADLVGPINKVLSEEEIAKRFKVDENGNRLQAVSKGKKEGAFNYNTKKYDLEDIIEWQPISEADYLKTIQGGTVQDYTGVTFAMGGNVQGNVPIEVEKQEVIEEPNGNMMQVDGPSHAQGGVDINVPEGSMVYSDKIKVGNKSLAKIVASETKKLDKAKKELEKNPTDKIARESVARIEENLEKKKVKFQKLQDIFNSNDPSKQSSQSMDGQGIPMQGQQQFMYGGRAKYEDGGPAYPSKNFNFNLGIDPNVQPSLLDPLYGNLTVTGDNMGGNYFDNSPSKPVTGNPTGSGIYNTRGNDLNVSKNMFKEKSFVEQELMGEVVGDELRDMQKAQMDMVDTSIPTEDYYMSKEHSDYLDNLNTKKPSAKGMKGLEGMNLTGGDIMGIAGTAYSGIAPMMNTMKNRANDTVNTNMYKNYGLQGLESLSESERNLRGLHAENEKDVERLGQTSRAQMRSSARGVNQLRAGDIATQQGMGQQKNKAWANFAAQQQQLDMQRAGMLNQRDQMVMQGAEKADIANRMDSDNYYTQLGADKANLGAMLQQMGSNLNQNKLGKEKMANLQKYAQMAKEGLISQAAFEQLVRDINKMEGVKPQKK